MVETGVATPEAELENWRMVPVAAVVPEAWGVLDDVDAGGRSAVGVAEGGAVAGAAGESEDQTKGETEGCEGRRVLLESAWGPCWACAAICAVIGTDEFMPPPWSVCRVSQADARTLCRMRGNLNRRLRSFLIQAYIGWIRIKRRLLAGGIRAEDSSEIL